MFDKKLLSSIYSDGSELFVSPLLPKKYDFVTIKIRFSNRLPVQDCFITTNFFGSTNVRDMSFDKKDDLYTYFSYKFKIEQAEFIYFFALKIEEKLYYFNQSGLLDYYPSDDNSFRIFTDVKYPEWILGTNFYHIFPDRFFNGNPNNDVKNGEYILEGSPSIKMDWQDTPLHYNQCKCLDFYGGDLEGVSKKIPYFKKLGVNGIYLNPIFLAPSVHKYDCANYFEVDPHFGGNKGLINLTKNLHKNGMKLVLDVSINHVGTENKWFNRNGLYYKKDSNCAENPNSKYRDFFFFNENGEPLSWFNTGTLMQLNYGNKELRDIIINNEDSLVKHYLKNPYNIDGWRFDVASMTGRNYLSEHHIKLWNDVNNAIKSTKNDAYIMSEEWADPKDFISPDRWDAVMNYYGFCSPVRNYLGTEDVIVQQNPKLKYQNNVGSAEILAKRLKSYLQKMPFIYQLLSFNLLDSHDISRLHNMPEINDNLVKIGAILQYTFLGTPSLYYGDELDIDGRIHENEGCRYPMPWNKYSSKNKKFKLYKKLNHFRLENKVLQRGSLRIFNSKNIICFVRFDSDSCIISLCNSSNSTDYITLNLDNIASNLKIPDKDIFGKKIKYKANGNEIKFKLRSQESLLIKL